MHTWISSKTPLRFPQVPYFLFHKEEDYGLLLRNPVSNAVWVWLKVNSINKVTAVARALKTIQNSWRDSGAGVMGVNVVVTDVVEGLKNGSRLFMKSKPLSETHQNMERCFKG